MRTHRSPQFRALALVVLLFASVAPQAQSQNSFPAVGFWNGFLDTLNVLECTSLARRVTGGRLEMRDSEGASLGGISFTIPSKQSTHIVMNAFDIRDRIGSLRVTLTDPVLASSGEIRCLTSVYRFSEMSGRVVDFAYSLPLKSLSTQGTWQLANGFHPDGETSPVDNWASIVNDGPNILEGSIEVFNDAGGRLHPIAVPPIPRGGRRDVLVNRADTSEPVSSQIARLIRFVPTSGAADYSVFVTRYGTVRGERRFAVPLSASTGSDGCASKPIFISTMNPAINWLELANVGTTALVALVDIKDDQGSSIITIRAEVEPKAQKHLLVSQFIPPRATGVLRISCNGSLLSNLLVYGRSATEATEWAYGAQPGDAADGDDQSIAFSVNTFLGMLNYARLGRSEVSNTYVDLESVRPGEPNYTQERVELIRSSTVDRLVSTQFPEDSVGLVTAQTVSGHHELFGDLLRVFSRSDGSLSTVMRVPAGPVGRRAPLIRLESFATGLDTPVGIVPAGDGSGRLFVLEQHKGIRVIQSGALLPAPFLDLSAIVSKGGEQGVLGLAFHPQFAANGLFYVHYTDLSGNTVISEFLRSLGDPNFSDPGSERIVLTQNQPFPNHNGGQLAFGPDELLYIGLGDGGSSGDPQGNGQNLNTFLGKILRIDVNGIPYAIPPSNPFVSGGGRPEIYAYGLRNPFRFSFDLGTGRLVAGDVGQNTLEEIDLIVAGGNYGWNTMEGSRCFSPPTGCDTAGKILPISEYGRFLGISVIGGYVYRGTAIPPLAGDYLFGDFGSGRIWALEESSLGFVRRELLDTELLISSFGEDESRELYISDIRGTIYRIRSGL